MKNYSLPNIIVWKNKCIKLNETLITSFNGEHDGKEMYWYENHDKNLEIIQQNSFQHSETNWKHSKLHGKETHWCPRGNKIYEAEWVNYKKHGKEIEYYGNGNKKYEMNWKYGKQHGKEIHWCSRGNKIYEVEWVDDKTHGKEIWYSNGNKEHEIEWKHGKKIHIKKFNYKSGICIMTIVCLGVIHWLFL